MADDMNKKGKGTTASSVGTEHLPLSIASAMNKASTVTLQHSDLERKRFNVMESPFFGLGQTAPGVFTSGAIGNQVNRANTLYEKYSTRIENITESQMSRSMNSIGSAIDRSFEESHIRGETERRLHDPNVQSKMLTYGAGNLSPYQIERHMNASDKRLAGFKTQLHQARESLYNQSGELNPEKKEAMNAVYGKYNEELNRRAALSGIAKNYREAGRDPLSVTMGHLAMQSQAQDVVSKNGAGAKEAEIFLETLKKLNAETDKTSKKFTELSEAVTKTGEDFMSGSGGGGGHKFLGMGAKGWGQAAAIGQIMSIAGSSIQTLGVDHRIRERQVMAGFANLANSKYDVYKSARDGDVASQMLMTQWGSADKFANQVKQTARAGEITSGVGNAIVGAAKTAGAVLATKAAIASGATVVGLPVSAILGGGAAALGASAMADFGEAGSNFFRGNKSGQAYIDATNAHMEAMRAVNAIPAEQYQGLRDFYTGAGGVARGMGARGEAFLNEITQSGPGSVLNDLSAARISPEQYVQMAQVGNDMMGSQFSKKNIFGARSLEVAGLGTVEQNMKRQGALATSGSNNPLGSLESVMAAAMTKGLDSSKAIDMMVTNTAAIVSQTGAAAAGIDTTAVTAAALATMVDPNIANKEFATERAKTIADIARSAETNVSTTYSGMVNTSRISAATGLSGIDAITAGEMTGAEWKALEGDPDAEKKLRSMGISVGAGGGAKMIATMIRLKQRQVAEGEGAANAMGGMSDSLFEKLRTGTLTDKDPEYDQAADIARRSKYKTIEEYQRAVQSGDTNVVSKDKLNDKVKSAEGSELGKIDKLMTGQMARLADQANVAAEGLKKLGESLNLKGGPLQRFIEAQEAAEKGGRQQEREASTMAANAAKDFNLAASNLNKGSSAFAQIMDKVADRLNITVKVPADDKTIATGRGDTSGRRRPGEW